MISSKKFKAEISNLAEIVRCHPEGVSLDELMHITGHVTPRRTLQYRLSVLTKSGMLTLEGAGKNSKYHSTEAAKNHLPLQIHQETEIKVTVPLSNEGKKVRQSISIPIQQRKHVSYRRQFLDSYEPNKTFYLPTSILNKLSKLGTSEDKDRPAGTYARKVYQRLLIDLSEGREKTQSFRSEFSRVLRIKESPALLVIFHLFEII